MKYYFNLESPEEQLLDEIGCEAASLVDAVDSAHAVVAEFDPSQFGPGEGWKLVIKDETGLTVHVIDLSPS